MQLCFFEDLRLGYFHPLTLTRPIDDLRIGILTIREKWEHEFSPSRTARLLRPELEGIFEPEAVDSNAPCAWINSRYLPESSLLEKITNLEPGSCLRNSESVIAANVDGSTSRTWLEKGEPDFHSLLVIETDYGSTIDNLWDLYLANGEEIAADIKRLGPSPDGDRSISGRALLEHPDRIWIGEQVRIEPGAILIAEEGPIYLGRGTTVSAGAILKGPVAVCENSLVKMGARIYGGTTVGPVCKVAGEINKTVFHSYCNKAHEGYIGSSVIGQWCNIGADTNTSNLKNSYTPVEMPDWESGVMEETDQLFIGTVMGDHSKTAINVQLNAGTVCGVSCNIFTSDFPPKLIPSFSWVGTHVIRPYKIEKALVTMRTVMQRRDVQMTEPYEKLMKHLSKQSRS